MDDSYVELLAAEKGLLRAQPEGGNRVATPAEVSEQVVTMGRQSGGVPSPGSSAGADSAGLSQGGGGKRRPERRLFYNRLSGRLGDLAQSSFLPVVRWLEARLGGRTRVGVINVTGYAGAELARILGRHPAVELVEVTGRSAAGEPLATSFAHLADLGMIVREEIVESEVCFSALPHHASTDLVPTLLQQGRKVVDISAGYRLHDEETYQTWYGAHPSPSFLAEAVYGLPELHRSQIQGARLVANPGCYPVASILALAPVAACIELDVIVDAKSGISGAGRSFTLSVNHYCEINESCQPYGLEGHRHQPEIAQELNELRAAAGLGQPLELTFVPHLVPMTRGIVATCYARLTQPMAVDELRQRYRDFYRDEPFVRVVESPPASKQTWGSNYCFICPTLSPQTGRLVVTACLDNLVKGAAGQAVQNMNLMLGHPETMGLEALPTYP